MAYKKAGQYLTEAEWQVMECVWEKAPCTGREVWEWFQGRCGETGYLRNAG